MNQLVDYDLTIAGYDNMLEFMQDVLSGDDFSTHCGLLRPYFTRWQKDAPNLIKGACYLLMAYCARNEKLYDKLSSHIENMVKGAIFDNPENMRISRECFYNYELLYNTLANSNDVFEHLRAVACAYLNEMISFDVYRDVLENAVNNVYDFKNMRRIKSYAEELKETKGENKVYFL